MSLPKGWIEVNLFDITTPKQWKTISVKNLTDDGYVVYGANGKIGFYFTYTHEKPTVMITCRGATCGNIHISEPFSYINGNAMALDKLSENIDLKYIYYYLRSRSFEDVVSGSAQPQITQEGLKVVNIPIAPLNEQKRIAKKLDELLVTVESIKTRLDNAPTTIKRFRQSILSAATSGKLTEEWREENKDVINVYDKLIGQKEKISLEEYQSKWNDFNIPQSWNCTYLKSLADLRLGKMLDKNKNIGEPVKYLANINVRWFMFELENLKEMRMTEVESKKLSIENEDIFICEGGEPGRAAIWKNGKTDITFQKALHRVRFQTPFVSEWLVMNLKIDADSNRLSQLFTGTTIKHFTGRSLAKYPILLPTFEEQKEIVSQVESLFTLVDSLEGKIEAAKKRVNKLTQSILAKAFRGELVEQDSNDESAEDLLERIKYER